MSRTTRRRFLEDSLLAAAMAAAMPAGRLLAQDSPQSSSPAEKLGVAVVGTGGRGGEHLGVFASRKDTEVLYVCDADEATGKARVEFVAKRQSRPPKYAKDFRTVLDDPAVDLVTTATPNHWHSLVAIWAMQAGKDVYVEKPVSHNVSEGRRCVQVARKYQRICQAGTQCRSMAGSIAAIEYVRGGKIGEVKLARGLCYKRRGSIGKKGTYQPPATLDYDLWCGPSPMVPLTRPKLHYDWHWVWVTGNGDLGNQGIHQMDLARWGLGLNRISDRVLSYGGRVGYEPEEAGETANTQVVMHEFDKEGKTLIFEVRGLETDDLLGARVGVIFYGTEGTVVLNSYTDGVALDRDGKVIEKFSGGGDHYDNFVQAVRSRKVEDLRGDILEGHLSSALCHTGNTSLRLGEELPMAEIQKRLADVKTNDDPAATFDRVAGHLSKNGLNLDATKLCFGQALECDSEAETFPGNEAATALCTREYRAPYIVPAADKI